MQVIDLIEPNSQGCFKTIYPTINDRILELENQIYPIPKSVEEASHNKEINSKIMKWRNQNI